MSYVLSITIIINNIFIFFQYTNFLSLTTNWVRLYSFNFNKYTQIFLQKFLTDKDRYLTTLLTTEIRYTFFNQLLSLIFIKITVLSVQYETVRRLCIYIFDLSVIDQTNHFLILFGIKLFLLTRIAVANILFHFVLLFECR